MSSQLSDVSYVVTTFTYRGAQSYVALMCGATQFTINIHEERVRDTTFHDVYVKRKDDIKYIAMSGKYREITNAFLETILSPCKVVFNRLAPYVPLYSLQDYCRPRTYDIDIVRDGDTDNVVAVYPEVCSYGFSYGISPARMSELNPRSSNVRIFNATELFIAPKQTTRGMESRVETSDGMLLFFKARLDLMQPEFDRELSILLTIAEKEIWKESRISHLAGLVALEDGTIVGMAIEWLDASPLTSERVKDLGMHSQKWEDQIRATVKKLHQHGIVWGDVNPMNILIDEQLDAWVMDFGGNCNIEFIDEENKEMETGDWQGIDRIFKDWLPKRRRQGSELDVA